jgi:hypothetical protein
MMVMMVILGPTSFEENKTIKDYHHKVSLLGTFPTTHAFIFVSGSLLSCSYE